MAFTIDALRTELQRERYASLVQAADDAAIAAMLNDRAGDEAASVSRATMPKGDFLLAIAPLALVLATKDAPTQAKWDRILMLITGSPDVVGVGSATVQSVLQLAKADGLVDDAGIAAISMRIGSLAEVLWGDGTIVTPEQVGAAR